ncbi:MAG TPA: ATP-binding protein [Desulfovibrio sp.]|uniref:ATP-binding protein n=1 Tax=Desulfovibrio sp. TaxID=885 RepID=UPI002D47269E|nr:ATP-binding protein [Desulfovibrio sp.]HZF62630.1 ATP-binding protein [Desulfovibrio sp.]
MLRESFVKSKKMPWLVLVASLAWLGLTGFLYSQAVQVNAEHSLELEHTRLSTMAQQLMDARNWNAAHGGVYVEKSDYGQPNPWLPESERTVTTQDGRTLVLVNPAYMSRQLAERSSREGVTISVISSAPLRPENMADVWEKSALARCAEEPPEVFTAPQPGNGQSLRLLSVLMAQQSCLRCHTNKKVGEVLGGISVSQDAGSFHKGLERQRNSMRLLYGLLAFTGVLAIGGLTFNLTHRRWLAEEASRIKSSFMGHLSHDMRTPLTAIVGMSELAQRTDLPEKERKKALGYLAQAAEALREMVGDITDHAALEQGTPTLESAPFDLRECLASCVNLYRPIADSKGISLTLGLDENLPQCAVGDSFRLRQALGNIVSNAVKFTEAGSVRIYATSLESTREHLKLAVSVTDTGPGMSQEDQARVFESFQRGRDTARTPGTGLGLNIARTLARLMGGEVELASRIGQGACFTLHVRLLQCAQPERATSRENVPMSDVAMPGAQDSAKQFLARKKVLVAEDTASIAYAMQHMLRGMGAEPIVAETGEKALGLLRDPHQGQWDLLVLDSRLPGIDGLEVLRALRNGDTLSPSGTLAVIYTATTSDAFLRQCEVLGADGVFLKPLSFKQLRHELEKLMAARSPEKPTDCPDNSKNVTQEKNALPNISASIQNKQQLSDIRGKNTVWNRNAALEALDGDEDVLKSLANVLESELHERLQALDAAIFKGDIEQLRRTAHACKNSAGVMRLDNLRAAAAATEEAQSVNILEEAQKLRSAMQEAAQALAAGVEQGKTA